MGGIQARAGQLSELHELRGGQLILRVAPAPRHGSGSGTPSSGSGSGSSSNSSGSSAASRLFFILPAFDGGEKCYILEQSMDVLEKIFLRLTPKELALLSLTSKAMNQVVTRFIEHYCSSYDIRPRMKRFYERNGHLLLPKDSVLKDRLAANSKHELMLYSVMSRFLCDVRRVAVADVDRFDHLTPASSSSSVSSSSADRTGAAADADRPTLKPPLPPPVGSALILQERDVQLRRNVVVLKKVNWLYFRHVFQRLPAGSYELQLRMRLSHVRWAAPQDSQQHQEEGLYHSQQQLAGHGNGNEPWEPAPAVMRASRADSRGRRGEELVAQRIKPAVWSRLEDDEGHFHNDLDNASVQFDVDSDWFFLRLARFRLEPEVQAGNGNGNGATSDLLFEFDDVHNLSEKSGVVFDFLELRRIEPSARLPRP